MTTKVSGYLHVSRFNSLSTYFVANALLMISMLFVGFGFNLCEAGGVSERFQRPLIEYKDPYDVSVENYGLPKGTVAGKCRYDGNFTE